MDSRPRMGILVSKTDHCLMVCPRAYRVLQSSPVWESPTHKERASREAPCKRFFYLNDHVRSVRPITAFARRNSFTGRRLGSFPRRYPA